MTLIVSPAVTGNLGPLTKNIFIVQSNVPIASITPAMLESTYLKVGDTIYVTDSDNVTSFKSIGPGFSLVNPSIGFIVEDVLTSTSPTNALSANQGKMLDDSKLNKSEVSYLIKSFHTQLLSANVSKTPSGNSVSLPELNLEIKVLQGDVLEVNSSLAADYAFYNDIGDVFNIEYKIGSGTTQNTITLGKIIGGDNNLETAAGNLYTPIQMNTSGTVTLSFSITTKTNSARTFLANHCGILAKLLRAPS